MYKRRAVADSIFFRALRKRGLADGRILPGASFPACRAGPQIRTQVGCETASFRKPPGTNGAHCEGVAPGRSNPGGGGRRTVFTPTGCEGMVRGHGRVQHGHRVFVAVCSMLRLRVVELVALRIHFSIRTL